jgi:hypothetical protein
VGEAYGLFSPQNLVDSGFSTPGSAITQGLALNCIFIASSAFNNYWDASSWSVETAMNLDDIFPKINQQINRRGIFDELTKTSNIATGRPRAPIKDIAGQSSDIWVVDVVAPCSLKLLILRDIICGHL